MGIIPEDDEEKWGTGKYEEVIGMNTNEGRPDIDDFENYENDGYEEEDDLKRAS
jgi:hypothetical protein